MAGTLNHKHFLLVDFENIHKIDNPGGIHGAYHIIIFLGSKQSALSVEFIQKCQPLGARLEWRKFNESGNNALDFLIAYEVGRITEKYPNAICTILSKDKGFGPLARHIPDKCRHVSDVNALKTSPEK
ncbi:MAG: PIN domain-containing protein [Alphaproteobacteria bacterium]|nr:PIN domain-containing protein [Alphaproteobacteria bacterium]